MCTCSYSSKLELHMIWFSLHFAPSRVYKGQGTTPNKSIREQKKRKKEKAFEKWCLCLHGACTVHTSTCTHEDVHTYEDTKKITTPTPTMGGTGRRNPKHALGL